MITINTRVITPQGPGAVKDIENIGRFKRYGVLHDVFPEGKPRMYTDDILYYLIKEIAHA